MEYRDGELVVRGGGRPPPNPSNDPAPKPLLETPDQQRESAPLYEGGCPDAASETRGT
jgi:hypothetical protein